MKKLIKISGFLGLALVMAIVGVLAAQNASQTSTVTITYRSSHAAVKIVSSAHKVGTDDLMVAAPLDTAYEFSSYDAQGSIKDNVNGLWEPNVEVNSEFKALALKFVITNSGSRHLEVTLTQTAAPAAIDAAVTYEIGGASHNISESFYLEGIDSSANPENEVTLIVYITFAADIDKRIVDTQMTYGLTIAVDAVASIPTGN